MTTPLRRCMDRDYEAASGDLLDDGAEPIFITRRSAGEDVVVLHARLESRVLFCDIVAFEAGLSFDDIVAMFVRTYLGTLTCGSLRADVERVEIRGGPQGSTAMFSFPSDEVLFG